MEELSEPLQKAVETGVPRFRHPRTQEVYVLIRAEEYERLAQDEGIAPGIVRSRRAFLRDLPSLLQNPKYDRWSVAYCGEERIALASSERDVVRECLKRGLKVNQYFLGVVAPYDYDGEIEKSLYEFDPIDE